jgi:predicted permease
MVIVTSLAASLAGWILLAVLERWTRRARTIWTILAAVVLVASFGGPLTAVAATTTKLALSLMHLAVGAALIPTLARTAAPGR